MVSAGERLDGLPGQRRRLGAWCWIALGVAVAVAWVVVWQLHAGHSEHGAASAGVARTVAVWLAMTAAMMLPTTVPMLRTLRDVLAADPTGDAVASRWWAFLSGYLAVWAVASVVGASLQVAAHTVGLVDADGGARSSLLVAAVLVLAGSYQFSPIKQHCQEQCVSPMTFFWRWWRDGLVGAWRMGARHGLMCLGCCWALMLLAFVGGMANLWLMLLCTVLMVIDKLPGVAPRVTAPLGATLIAAGTAAAVLSLTSAGADGHLHGAGRDVSAPSASTDTQERDR
jgi:predicted metal-binding membrane protein